MLKKIISILIIITFTIPFAYARVGQPTFVFAINDNPAAASEQNNSSNDGLSGGAITAITLGSIGGASVLGLAGWLYKRKLEQNLTAGCVSGSANSLVPFCIERNPSSEFYARINKKYPYLKKALSLNEIHYCPNSKYLLIYDTSIEKRTFNSIKFNLPQGTKNLKITHVTDPYKNDELTVELFFNQKNNEQSRQGVNVLKNIKNEITDIDGVIMKTIPVDTSKNDTGLYVINNYSEKKIYGIVFEFIF